MSIKTFYLSLTRVIQENLVYPLRWRLWDRNPNPVPSVPLAGHAGDASMMGGSFAPVNHQREKLSQSYTP